MLLVLPYQLSAVARFRVHRHLFVDRAGQFAARFLAQETVGVFLDFRVAHVLVGELAAHEGPGTGRGTYALDPLQRRQIKPLVVLGREMTVGQQGRALNVARLVEDEQALVAVALHFQDLETDLAAALLALTVAQDHGQIGREVTETIVAGGRLVRDRKTDFLRRGILRKSGRRHQSRQRQQEGETGRGAKGTCPAWLTIHSFLRSNAISRGGKSRKSARKANMIVMATSIPSAQLTSNPDAANTRNPADNTAVVVPKALPTVLKA